MLQLCPILCDPIDYPTSSSVHGNLQARILENLLKPTSLMSPTLAGRFFTTRVTRGATNVGEASSISVGKIPWRRKWQPTLVFLPGKSHGLGSLVDYTPWDCGRVKKDLAAKQHVSLYKKSVYSSGQCK